MGTRMEKHKQKKEKKNRKKLKVITLTLIIALLILELNVLDTKLRQSTNTQETSIYSVSVGKDKVNLELFGNKYYLSKKEVKRLLQNLKGTVKSIKDQSALVF